MDSKDLMNKICEEIEEYETTILNLQELHQREFDEGDISHIADMELKEYQNNKSKIIRNLIDNLYSISNKENFYFFDTPSEVYIKSYKSRLNEHLTEFPESIEKDFIEKEIKTIDNPNKYRLFKYTWEHGGCLYYHKFIKDNLNFDLSRKRKLEFLEELLQNQFPVKEEDYSKNAKQLTANQIVLLLQEVGFFTHPKIEDASKVKQAELINKICGLTPKNIKSHIEKLDKSHLIHKANYQKDIDKINQILNDLT